MKITEITTKIYAGTELTSEEKEFLKNYTEPDSAEKNSQMQAEINQLKNEIETAKNKDLPELEQLKIKLAEAETERDEIKNAKANLELQQSISSLAAKHKFIDVEFLKYLVTSRKIDVDKNGETFIGNLKKESPKYFAAEVNPGGGGTNQPPPESTSARDEKTRYDLLLAKKEPLSRIEQLEIFTLGEKIKNTQTEATKNNENFN